VQSEKDLINHKHFCLQALKEFIRIDVDVYIVGCDRKYFISLKMHRYKDNVTPYLQCHGYYNVA